MFDCTIYTHQVSLHVTPLTIIFFNDFLWVYFANRTFFIILQLILARCGFFLKKNKNKNDDYYTIKSLFI